MFCPHSVTMYTDLCPHNMLTHTHTYPPPAESKMETKVRAGPVRYTTQLDDQSFCARAQPSYALLQASEHGVISHLISPTSSASCRLQVSYHYLLMKDCSACCRCLSYCRVVVSSFSPLLLSLSHFFPLSPSLPP